VEIATSHGKGELAKGRGKRVVRRRNGKKAGKKENPIRANVGLVESDSLSDEEDSGFGRAQQQRQQLQRQPSSPHNHGVEKGLRSQISTLNAQLKTFQDKHQVAEQKCERVLLAARLQKKEGVQWGESRPADSRLSNEPPKVARKTLYGTDEDGDDDDDYGDGDYSDYRPKRSVASRDDEHRDQMNQLPVSVNEGQQSALERASSLKAKMDR
jgi:hypothetical protein